MALAINSQMPSNVADHQVSTTSPVNMTNFTNTAGTVLYIVATIDIGPSSSPPTGIGCSYGGVAMTLLGTGTANNGTRGSVSLFRLKTPATGSNAVQLSWTGGAAVTTYAAISLTGEDTVPDSGTATTGGDTGTLVTSFSIARTGTTNGNIVIAGFGYGDPGTPTAGQTLSALYDADGTSYTNNNITEYTTSSGGTATMTVSGLDTATVYAAVAIEVLVAGGGGGGSTTLGFNVVGMRPNAFAPGLAR